MIWHVAIVYLTGVLIFFFIFTDELESRERWVVLLWPLLIVGGVGTWIRRYITMTVTCNICGIEYIEPDDEIGIENICPACEGR